MCSTLRNAYARQLLVLPLVSFQDEGVSSTKREAHDLRCKLELASEEAS